MENILQHCRDIISKNPNLKIKFTRKVWETDFFRFFRSMTNYIISKRMTTLSCLVYSGKRSMNFSIMDPTVAKLDEKMKFVKEHIDSLPEDPDFVDLEDNKEINIQKNVFNNIENYPSEKKINILKKLADDIDPLGFKLFGTFITNFVEYTLINSNGLDKTFSVSPLMLEVKAVNNKNDVTVIQSMGGYDPKGLDFDFFEEHLKEKIRMADSDVIDMDAGKYDVILSPYAIGEFISYLTMGLNGHSIDSKRSFFLDKKGKKLFPEHINLFDDPLNEKMIPYPYNQDGYPLNKLPIITDGVLENYFINNYYSHKLNMKKTGNMGTNLVLEPGKRSLDEMIGNVKKGLYISKLHYMNFMNARETSVTGLTRDGTFLIEDGKIKNVVNNLRYTVKIADVVSNITELENTTHPVTGSGNYGEFDIYTAQMPHVRVKDFRISSSTHTI